MDDLPSKVDLLVLGAGAAGMTAALTAAMLGMDVLLVEKTGQVGGTRLGRRGRSGSRTAISARRARTASTAL